MFYALISLIALAVLVALLVIVIALQSPDCRYSRSTTIASPPAAPFAEVNDFHRWASWSPWEKLDPATKKTYDGSPAGVGAKYAWSGNSNVGEGRMTIIESQPHELIRITIEFLKPMAAVNTIDFTFKQEGDQTVVTQCMFGKRNFMSKAFGLVMNMDKMIGGMFDKGLAQIKANVEGAGKG